MGAAKSILTQMMQPLPVLDPKADGIDVGSGNLHVSIAGNMPKIFDTTTGQLHALRDWLTENCCFTRGDFLRS